MWAKAGTPTALAATVFDGLRIDGRGVAQVETGAVHGEQAVAAVEGCGMAGDVGHRTQDVRQNLVDEFPTDGKRALAQGAVGSGDSGDGFDFGFGFIAGVEAMLTSSLGDSIRCRPRAAREVLPRRVRTAEKPR